MVKNMGPFYILFALFFSSLSFFICATFKEKVVSQASWEQTSSWGKKHGEEFPGSLVGWKFCELQPKEFSCTLRNL